MSKYSKPGTQPRAPVNPADQEDAFVAKTLEFTSWAQSNRPVLVLALVVLGLGAAAFLYYRNYTEVRNTTAAAQLENLQQRMEQGDQTGVQADLELFVERFEGTPFELEARMALAQVNTNLGDPQSAVEVLEPAVSDIADPLGAQAAALLAAIAEDAGNQVVAEGLYERLADRSELSFQVRDALGDAARLRVAQGDLEGALEFYDRLLDEIDEGDLGRGVVEMRRAEIAARIR